METATQKNDTLAPLLEMRGIRKAFPGVVALDEVDFDLLPGEVHALIGENGAGKSTMIKIIAGLYRRDSGQLLVGGDEVDFRGPADSIARHIKVVYQELDLVPGLSVAENVFLGAYPKTQRRTRRLGSIASQHEAAPRRAGSGDRPRDSGRRAARRRTATGRDRARPFAKCPDRGHGRANLGAQHRLRSIGSSRSSGGCKAREVAIIYVSHKLDEIYRIADRVTVLRDGKHVVTTEVAGTKPHDLVTWMVGRELKDLFPKSEVQRGPVLLKVTDVSGSGIENFDLTVHAGEIVGLFGLMGAGINTVGRVLFGASDEAAGPSSSMGSRSSRIRHRTRWTKGMGLLDRKPQG